MGMTASQVRMAEVALGPAMNLTGTLGLAFVLKPPMPAKCYSSYSWLTLHQHSCVFSIKETPGAPTKLYEDCALCFSSGGGPLGPPHHLPPRPLSTSASGSVLVPLGLGPELLPRVGGFLRWHHFQPLLIISSKAINLLQVGVFPFVL